MMLEQALCDENEYSRLEKIRIGCRYISSQLPFLTSFKDPQTIKLLICCYPFSQNNVELLVQAFFDRFNDLDFFNSFFQAVNDIAQFPETRVLLSNLRNFRQKSQRKISQKVSLQTTQIYAKDVLENLLVVKQFSATYLFQLFQLGYKLQLSLEQHAKIFLKYLKNTREENFITQLIDIFQDVKQNILHNTLWSIALEDEIEQYFYTTQHPPTLTKIDIPSKGSDSSASESEIDMHEVIEKWICNDKTGIIREQVEYFRNDQYFDFLMKFIFDPLSSHPASGWAEQVQSYQETTDYRAWKLNSPQLEKIYLVRSSKLLKLITHDQNYSIISKKTPQLLLKIFFLIYEGLGDCDKLVNLYHIGQVLDYLLTQSPKSCLFFMADLNLLFSLTQFIYNPQIQQVLEKLLNMVDDEYQLGMHVQEQLWQYILFTDLFEHLTQIMTNIPIDKSKLERIYKPEKLYNILPLLKAQTNFDKLPRMQETNMNQKKFLTDLLGQMTPGKTINDYYGMSQNNWHLYDDIQENITSEEFDFKDLDNLKEFAKQRNQNTFKFVPTFKRQKTIQLQQQNAASPTKINLTGKKSALDSLLFDVKTPPSNNNKIQSIPRLSSASKQTRWINANGQQNYLRQGTLKKAELLMSNTTVRLRTFGSDRSDFSSNDGFSSSKLRTIYPSVKVQQETTFERELQKVKKNEHIALACSSLIKGLVQSAFYYCWKKTNTLGICKAQYKLNIDSMLVVLLNKICIERYFQIYLSSIHCHQDGEVSSADECGMIINLIYQNYPRLKQQNQIINNLKECFLSVSDYFCKTIICLNKQQQKMDHQQLNYKKFIMTQTLFYGLQIFECSKSQQLSKNPYLHLNETVLHILIIWYFDSLQHNIQQNLFVNLFILIMTRAPVHIIMHLIFKLGFITSLYNFQTKQNQNGFGHSTGVESFHLHLKFVVHIINEAIKQRNLVALQQSLNQLQSWQQLLKILPDPATKAVLIINQRMKTATVFIPANVVNQFHSIKSLDSDQTFKPKIVVDHLKQKLHIISQDPEKKSSRFLKCVQEKVTAERKFSQKK